MLITPRFTDIIFNKYGTIPTNENDLWSSVMRAGTIIEERDLAHPKRTNHNLSPSGTKDKRKDAGMGKETEKSSLPQKCANTQGNKIPHVAKDKYPDQEILWPSFVEALNGVVPEDFQKHREVNTDCRRCGRNKHKTRACIAQKTIAGTKLPEHPKMPAGKAASAGTKRLHDQEEINKEPLYKKVAAIPKTRIWEVSESENNTEMANF